MTGGRRTLINDFLLLPLITFIITIIIHNGVIITLVPNLGGVASGETVLREEMLKRKLAWLRGLSSFPSVHCSKSSFHMRTAAPSLTWVRMGIAEGSH